MDRHVDGWHRQRRRRFAPTIRNPGMRVVMRDLTRKAQVKDSHPTTTDTRHAPTGEGSRR